MGRGTAQVPGGRAVAATVIAWLDAQTSRLAPEDVALADAADRVTGRTVVAAAAVPAFDRAVIDGVALRAHETVGASAYNPLRFPAVRCAAGGKLPPDTDSIVALETVLIEVDDTCELVDPVTPGDYVERAGAQVAPGDPILDAGQRVDPHAIGLLAAAGVFIVPVIRRPRVRVVLAGHDIVPDSDGSMLQP